MASPPDELAWLLDRKLEKRWADPNNLMGGRGGWPMITDSKMPPVRKWPADLTADSEIPEPARRGPRLVIARRIASAASAFHLTVFYPVDQRESEEMWPASRVGTVAGLVEFELHYPQPFRDIDPHSEFRYQLLRCDELNVGDVVAWLPTLDVAVLRTLAAPRDNKTFANAIEQITMRAIEPSNALDLDSLAILKVQLLKELTEQVIAGQAFITQRDGYMDLKEYARMVGMDVRDLALAVREIENRYSQVD